MRRHLGIVGFLAMAIGATCGYDPHRKAGPSDGGIGKIGIGSAGTEVGAPEAAERSEGGVTMEVGMARAVDVSTVVDTEADAAGLANSGDAESDAPADTPMVTKDGDDEASIGGRAGAGDTGGVQGAGGAGGAGGAPDVDAERAVDGAGGVVGVDGTAGSSAAGGTVGAGGVGATPGTGGMNSLGGIPGSGGVFSLGGVSGNGGMTGGGGATGSGGVSSSGGITGTGGTTLQPNGASCGDDSECQSGHCPRKSICCQTACGECEYCGGADFSCTRAPDYSKCYFPDGLHGSCNDYHSYWIGMCLGGSCDLRTMLAQCPSAQYCLDTPPTTTCVDLKSSGSSCTSRDECSSGRCVGNVCQ
jgi:hypothetical protein